MIATYRSRSTDGVGSSASRFLSPVTAEGTMSSPAGALALDTAEKTPKANAIAMKLVAVPSTMAGARAR